MRAFGGRAEDDARTSEGFATRGRERDARRGRRLRFVVQRGKLHGLNALARPLVCSQIEIDIHAGDVDAA